MDMAIKALFTHDYGKENMSKMAELGYDITVVNEKDMVFTDSISDIEIMSCYNPFSIIDVSKMKKLKWIQLASIGIDQLPVKDIENSNIIVTNNKGGYSIPMGEWVVLSILELIKCSKSLFENQANKKWKSNRNVMELYKKTVGFIGTGTIPKEAAKRLQGFGVNILGMNTKGRATEHFDKCYSRDNMNEMLSLCDAVVLAIPSTNETYHLMNKESFDSMKDGAVIVNVARGNIIDEIELIERLKNGKIRGAALDVVEQEPLPETNPLWDFPNVIITPHNSWVSEEHNQRKFELTYENMKRYAEGRELLNLVDIHRGY